MNKREQITRIIEEYISQYVKNEVELSAYQIRSWPIVDELCENQNSANICHAMKSVKRYKAIHIKGAEESTTFTMRYTK